MKYFTVTRSSVFKDEIWDEENTKSGKDFLSRRKVSSDFSITERGMYTRGI